MCKGAVTQSGRETSWQHAHNQETRGAHPSGTSYRCLVRTPAAFPIPARQISAIDMPSIKSLKNALRPRKVSACRQLGVSMLERPRYRSGYGIRQREIKYSQLIVGANTRVEVEHQKRQNSKHHRKQGQRRAMGAVFCEREAEQNNRQHEGGIAKDHFVSSRHHQ
jgi:hypothetical protein